jgi:hypothetical protein
MNKAVCGIYKTRRESEIAVNALRTNGFQTRDISVLLPESMGAQDYYHIRVSKTPEGVMTDATSGAFLGGTLSLLASLGKLSMPGIGPLIAAGPLMAAIVGAEVGGTTRALAGGLIGFGIAEDEARKYEESVKNGGVLVFIYVYDFALHVKAKNILELTGSIN